MYTSPTPSPLATMPALYVKNDVPSTPVFLAPDNLRVRFVCVKHRRNLITDGATDNDGRIAALTPVQRGHGVTNAFTSDSYVDSAGCKNVYPVLFDFDISYMYCPENRVDEYMNMSDHDLKRWIDQHPWYIDHEEDIANEFDCANHYRVMFEFEEE